MISHHPDDSLLMALAAGSVARGPAAVIGAHAEGCVQCHARLQDLEAVGIALLDRIEPASLGPGAFERTMARIDLLEAEGERPAKTKASRPGLRAKLPAGVAWPLSLRGGIAQSWLRLGPNVRWCRVMLRDDPAANVYLLRVAAGKHLPVHTHRGGEFTHVLYGAFHDDSKRFSAGDFDAADDRVHHQPIAAEESECICLTSVEGQLAFDGPVPRMVGSLLGL